MNSFAAQYETAGNSSSFAAVNSFFNSITTRHSFATGGSNNHEYWGPPLTMADAIMEVGPIHSTSLSWERLRLPGSHPMQAYHLPTGFCHDV